MYVAKNKSERNTNNGKNDGGDHGVKALGSAKEKANGLNKSHGNGDTEGDEQLQAENGIDFADEAPSHLRILHHARVQLAIPLLQIHAVFV